MKQFGLICSMMVLTACGQANVNTSKVDASKTLQSLTLEDIDFSTYSMSLAKFVDLEVGESNWTAIDKMRLHYAPEDGKTILQTKTSTFDRPDGSVMVYTVSGLKDDSVKAEELFMIFKGEKESQTLAAYGLKVKCQRGSNTTEWQMEVCP